MSRDKRKNNKKLAPERVPNKKPIYDGPIYQHSKELNGTDYLTNGVNNEYISNDSEDDGICYDFYNDHMYDDIYGKSCQSSCLRCKGIPRFARRHPLFHDSVARLFMLIILIAENFFRLKRNYKHRSGISRFMNIISKLRLELQMKICKVRFGDFGENVTISSKRCTEQLCYLLYDSDYFRTNIYPKLLGYT